MYAVPVIDLLLLHSKLNPFACSLKIDLGPLHIFSADGHGTLGKQEGGGRVPVRMSMGTFSRCFRQHLAKQHEWLLQAQLLQRTPLPQAVC